MIAGAAEVPVVRRAFLFAVGRIGSCPRWHRVAAPL
jgi:hypothetical protein